MNIKKQNKRFLERLKKIFFPFYKSKEIKELFNILEKDEPKNKEIAMFVGGCVRKFLLKHEIDDVDLASILTTEEIKEKFKKSEFSVIETGVKHGSVTIIINKKKFEITTLRKDIKTDGRHAEVSFTENWQEDSHRRDLTINAIYLNKNGKIFDPQNGISDLKEGRIKFIGEPTSRIEEDYLRIIRFLRFSIEYNFFEHDIKTISAIKLNLNGVKNISKERIFNELNKILKLENIHSLLKDNNIKNIFSLIFPEFKFLDRLYRIKELVDQNINIDKINTTLSALLIGAKDNHEYFCHKYKTSNNLKNYLDLIAKNYQKYNKEKNFLTKDIKINIYFFGKDNFIKILTFIYIANSRFTMSEYKKIYNQVKNISIPTFPFNGNLLIAKGVPSGKKIGEALKMIELNWIKNNFNLPDKEFFHIISKFK